jgi:pyruvate ferredoxin oxidoreductase beta subunit
MNTGVQRSSATPLFAKTTTTPMGKKEEKKNMPFIIASHGNVYVATANIAHPIDLQNKLKKALAFNGPSYIQIFSPCVPGWGYSSGETVQLARLAVETRASVLYEIENGIVKLNHPVENPKQIKIWLERQSRFRHLTTEEIEKLHSSINDYYKHIKKLSDAGIKLF